MAFVKFSVHQKKLMETKIPFKVKLNYLLNHEDRFEGKAEFHEKEYSIQIQPQKENGIIRIPFTTMGVTDNNILVRVSGPSGIYVQDYIKLKGESDSIEINSYYMFYEITNNHEKFDTLEIFVK